VKHIKYLSVVFIVCLAFVFFLTNHNHDEVNNEQPNHGSYNLFQQIADATAHNNYSPEITERILVNLHKNIPFELREKLKKHSVDFSPSFNHFFKQFKHCFSNNSKQEIKQEEGFILWLAWLLAETIQNDSSNITTESRLRAKNEFAAQIPFFVEMINIRYECILGPDYRKFQRNIEIYLDHFSEHIIRLYTLLHEDPLYPALKNPISSKAWKDAEEACIIQEITPKYYEEPETMMVLREERIDFRMEMFFRELPHLLFYYLTMEEIDLKIQHNDILGDMLYMSNGTGQVYWPLKIFCEKNKK